MTLPPVVARRVERATGRTVTRVVPVGGGCINHGARVELAGRAVFAKWRAGTPPGFFAAEADGLRRLAATDTVRVPEVLDVSDDGAVGSLVMTWVRDGRDRRSAMEDAGRRLARLHGLRGRSPGLDRDNVVGALAQQNTPPSDGQWLTFFRRRRLGALAHALPGGLRRRLEGLPLEAWLGEPEGGCALLHGDLWGGNVVIGDGGEGWLVDPAVYAGHPEVDLAMTRLFGGFDERFYAAYQEVAGPFGPGLDARLDLLNLYPLLVHVHLFGGGYVSQVEAVVSRYGGRR